MMKRVSDAAAGFAGSLRQKAGAVLGKSKKAETGAARATAGPTAGPAAAAREGILASPIVFRSIVGALVLMGTVQWALIAFNYWR
ncbi:MAG: hypothetical protein AAFU72_04065 [Pseudomonadota bacterium]